MRQKQIIGNWKMYGTLTVAEHYLDVLLSKDFTQLVNKKIKIAPPFTLIAYMAKRAKGSFLEIGAQNLAQEAEGAFTGEVSGTMIKDAGACFVIVGHSERRRLFQETGDQIRKKIHQALALGLQPIVCIGETQEDREKGQTKNILQKQLDEALKDVCMERVIVAYEPIWAIGTGQNASPEIAEEVHFFCRDLLSKRIGPQALQVPIIYGGSVKAENVGGFLAKDDIDGVLVGGASLDPESFFQIIQSS